MLLKSKAAIEVRLTDEDTPRGIAGAHRVETRLDQSPPDPFALVFRQHRQRPHEEPAGRCVADPRRRIGDVTHHRAIHFGDERQRQRAVLPQGVDDERLSATADRVPGEG